MIRRNPGDASGQRGGTAMRRCDGNMSRRRGIDACWCREGLPILRGCSRPSASRRRERASRSPCRTGEVAQIGVAPEVANRRGAAGKTELSPLDRDRRGRTAPVEEGDCADVRSDRVFDQTCRFVAGVATSCPWAPSGSWSIAITSAFVIVVFVAFDMLRRSFPGDERRGHDRPHAEVRASLRIRQTVADLQHVGVVPVAGAGVRRERRILIDEPDDRCPS